MPLPSKPQKRGDTPSTQAPAKTSADGEFEIRSKIRNIIENIRKESSKRTQSQLKPTLVGSAPVPTPELAHDVTPASKSKVETKKAARLLTKKDETKQPRETAKLKVRGAKKAEVTATVDNAESNDTISLRKTAVKSRRAKLTVDTKAVEIAKAAHEIDHTSVDTSKAAATKAGSTNAGISATVADTLFSAPNPQILQTGRRGRASTPEHLKKLFVLDTNVLMHDPLCIFHFAEHDVFLPMTVLEELDNHKKGTSDVARNARTVSRSLDTMMELNGADLSEGVPLSLLGNKEAGGRLYFETHNLADEIPEDLPTFKGDNRILAVVRGVIKAFPKRGVVLVSKDINMRIKATALGIPAEDYLSDKVLDDTDLLYSGKLAMPADFWQTHAKDLESWQDNGATHYRFTSKSPEKFVINQCLSIEGDPDFMAIVTAIEGENVTVRLLKDYRTRAKVWGIQARNAEQNMALNLLMDPDIDFVTILGQAGTGKTLMTLAAGLTQTMDDRRFSEIIVTRATVSVGEDIGFLPGTEEEKMAPWMGALEDNLEVLQRTDDTMGGDWGRHVTMDLIKTRIRIKSMSFMRGRTFLKKFVIIDEAQNLSPKQMKTLITRAGPGTKIVCLGNIAQIDTPYLTEGSSGLTYVVERFQGWNHAATITLTRGERSRLADYATEVL